MKLNPDNLRESFHALSAKASAIQARLDPLRAELGTLVAGTADLSLAAAVAREAEIRAALVAGQAELFPIEQERAQAARILKAMKEDTGPLREDALHLQDN